MIKKKREVQKKDRGDDFPSVLQVYMFVYCSNWMQRHISGLYTSYENIPMPEREFARERERESEKVEGGRAREREREGVVNHSTSPRGKVVIRIALVSPLQALLLQASGIIFLSESIKVRRFSERL